MLRIIGDCHGKFNHYLKLARESKYSVQLGDFGFGDCWRQLNSSGLNPENHKIVAGNHDSYSAARHSPFYLGDFGTHELDSKKFFFIRGAISLDRVYRIGEELSGGPKTWWSEEELNFKEMLECAEVYAAIKPDFVLSHAPPGVICDRIHGNKHTILQKFKFHFGFKENTSLLGDHLLSIHKPKLWVFGHHHKTYNEVYDGTEFRCLAELETFDIQ